MYHERWDYSKLVRALWVFGIKPDDDEEVKTLQMLKSVKEQLVAEDDTEPEPFDPNNLGVSEFVQLVLLEPSCTIIKFVEEVRQCQEVFSLFDEDGSDQITVSELGFHCAVFAQCSLSIGWCRCGFNKALQEATDSIRDAATD